VTCAETSRRCFTLETDQPRDRDQPSVAPRARVPDAGSSFSALSSSDADSLTHGSEVWDQDGGPATGLGVAEPGWRLGITPTATCTLSLTGCKAKTSTRKSPTGCR
jgi:hypothetical protein